MKKWFVGNDLYYNEWSIYDTKEEAIQEAKNLSHEYGGYEAQVFEGELCGTASIPEPEAIFKPVEE